jgi:hypothetical protein
MPTVWRPVDHRPPSRHSSTNVFSPHDVPFRPFSMSRQGDLEECASESQDAQKWIAFLRRGEVLQPTQWYHPRILSVRLPVHLPCISLE